MSKLIIGVDAGNYRAKVAGPYGVDAYRTAICDWFPRNVVESHGKDDMEFEIGGRRGYAGTIAANEDIYGGGARYGESKAHEDTKIRVLLAVYRYIERYCPGVDHVSIVTGQPITSHNEIEKRLISDMLVGPNDFTVNGKRQRIYIENAGVATEGGGAFWCVSRSNIGKKRIIDAGSGTSNLATVKDKRFINNDSRTLLFGAETGGDTEGIARGIIQGTTRLRWSKSDSVEVCGGIATDILPHIRAEYASAVLLKPQLPLIGGGVMELAPVYANAVGFYNIARLTYG